MTNGRNVGVMMSLLRRERALVLPASGDVGSQYTPAAGWAQAIVYRQRVLKEEDWEGARRHSPYGQRISDADARAVSAYQGALPRRDCSLP
jgi:hypothetical protein